MSLPQIFAWGVSEIFTPKDLHSTMVLPYTYNTTAFVRRGTNVLKYLAGRIETIFRTSAVEIWIFNGGKLPKNGVTMYNYSLHPQHF